MNPILQQQEDAEIEELVGKAIEICRTEQKISTSILQRRFRLGYTRASRVMDMLESLGIVGPGDGAKPREILSVADTAIGEEYVIYSPKHTRGIAFWWRPNSCGYTDCVDRAGRYSKEEALKIQQGSRGLGAVAIPVSALSQLETKRIVDLGWMENEATLGAWAIQARKGSEVEA